MSVYVSYENKSEQCKGYFYWSAEFLKSSDETAVCPWIMAFGAEFRTA